MTEPCLGVVLALYVGEDWRQILTFFSDPVATPQTFNDPMALTSPEMAIREYGRTPILAELNAAGSGVGAGTTAVGGTDGNQLTLGLPFAWTYRFEQKPKLVFDIFDIIDGQRIAIVKNGIITVSGATTEADGS